MNSPLKQMVKNHHSVKKDVIILSGRWLAERNEDSGNLYMSKHGGKLKRLIIVFQILKFIKFSETTNENEIIYIVCDKKNAAGPKYKSLTKYIQLERMNTINDHKKTR